MGMKSKEEILASKLDDLLADSRIEPYLVGRYFAQMARVDIYDNFEELVESARQEKQDRIEWLKDIIIGETEVTKTNQFDLKCQVLMDIPDFADSVPECAKWLEPDENILICDTASAWTAGYIDKLSDEGLSKIEYGYDYLLELFGVDDQEWYFLQDIVDYKAKSL
jgi:hypothetical protein